MKAEKDSKSQDNCNSYIIHVTGKGYLQERFLGNT